MWCVITETTGIFPLSPGQKDCGRVWVQLDMQECPSHPDPCMCGREGRQRGGWTVRLEYMERTKHKCGVNVFPVESQW